jgi:DNA-binding FadR family transcriptional regulator
MAIKNMLGHTLDLLGESIVSGHYPPESVVPPETVLCKEFGVSRTVIREAVKSLVAKGLLSSARGRKWERVFYLQTNGIGLTPM